MADFFNGVISSVKVGLGTVGTFFLLLCLSLAFGVAFLFACVFKRDFTLKKRIAFFPFLISVLAIQGGAEIALGGDSFILLLFGVCVGIVGVALVIPVKKVEYKKEHVEFARFLDQKTKSVEKFNERTEYPVEKIKCVEKEQKLESAGIDYSHVKHILSKMEYYPLSVADKRQVKDLSIAVNLAEEGDNGADIKNRINDGLGALLKIMSKHGI